MLNDMSRLLQFAEYQLSIALIAMRGYCPATADVTGDCTTHQVRRRLLSNQCGDVTANRTDDLLPAFYWTSNAVQLAGVIVVLFAILNATSRSTAVSGGTRLSNWDGNINVLISHAFINQERTV